MNTPGYENDTPLHDAVANGHVAIARLLVARGGNSLLRYTCTCMYMYTMHMHKNKPHEKCVHTFNTN